MKARGLVISQGAPTFALEPGALGPELLRRGRRMAGIRAVLVVSPHWRAGHIKVMTRLVIDELKRRAHSHR